MELVKVTNGLLTAFDKGLISILVLLDLRAYYFKIIIIKLSESTPYIFYCYKDDTHLYLSMKPDETHQLDDIQSCLKDITNWMSNKFLMLN